MSIAPNKVDRRGERPCLEPWVLVAVMEELSRPRKRLTLWERFKKWLKGMA